MVNAISQCLTAVVIIQFVVFSGKDKVQGYWSVFNCDSHLINIFAYPLVVRRYKLMVNFSSHYY